MDARAELDSVAAPAQTLVAAAVRNAGLQESQKSRSAASIPVRSRSKQWKPATCPACISSAKWWT